MTTKPRKLKLFSIHDNYKNLVDKAPEQMIRGLSDYVELYEIRKRKIIDSWLDVLIVLNELRESNQSIEFDIPDILIVDCRFEYDEKSPDINNLIKKYDAIDSRGLLYGSIILPFLMSKKPYKPMACEIYSQELRKATDGYSQTFYSLITTLIKGLPNNIELEEKSLKNYFLKSTEEGSSDTEPQEALRSALSIYRKNVQHLIKSKKTVFPDRKSFEHCANIIEKTINSIQPIDYDDLTEDGEEQRKNIIIKNNSEIDKSLESDELFLRWWTYDGQEDCIFLKSFIFDCKEKDNWDIEKIKEVKKLLEDTVDCSFMESIYNPVKKRIEDNNTQFDRCDENNKVCIADEQKMFWILIELASDEYKERERKSKSNTKIRRISALNLISFAKDYNDIKRVLDKFFIHDKKTTHKFVEDFRNEDEPFPSCLSEYKEYIVQYLESIKLNNRDFIPKKLQI